MGIPNPPSFRENVFIMFNEKNAVYVREIRKFTNFSKTQSLSIQPGFFLTGNGKQNTIFYSNGNSEKRKV